MKITSLAVVLASVALTLASASNPCQAGSITYDFVEGTGAPNPGAIGATITISSPPASPSSGWTTSAPADILALQIIEQVLFPDDFTGAFNPAQINNPLSSSTGTSLSTGFLTSVESQYTIQIEPSNTNFEIDTNPHDVTGVWVVSTSVPEPRLSGAGRNRHCDRPGAGCVPQTLGGATAAASGADRS